jgi:transposase-like protein
MSTHRKQYSAQFKFQVALEAAQGRHTLNELASRHGVHPNQIGQWKRQLLEHGPQVFNGPPLARQQQAQQARETQLFEQIGRLQMELEWLKKKSAPLA